MIRSLIGISTILLGLPYVSLHLGQHFQSQIAEAENSAVPWRRARLSYRIAKFSPLLWETATEAENTTDLILSDHFFSQVLRGEQDAIVPQNHLDFLSDRPDTDRWNAIRAETLLTYGEFDEALALVKSDTRLFAPQTAIAAFFTGDTEPLQQACTSWIDCPTGWRHALPFDTTSTDLDWRALDSNTQPIAVEWILLNEPSAIDTDTVWQHNTEANWRCALLTEATVNNAPDRIASATSLFWGEDGSEWWASYGQLVQSSPCHPNRFEQALAIAAPEDRRKLELLQAVALIGLVDISNAQRILKGIDLDGPDTTESERILAYHVRILSRELAGDPNGMEKYAELGKPLHKALFSIHLGKSKLYQQAKTTAIQNFSALNGYPIPTQLQQEYTDMLMLSKRLNGSAGKIQIGTHQLEYDFMDNDGNFREWLVRYTSESLDNPTGTPMTIPLLRFWRGEDKHADQLIQTHLESSVHPHSVIMSTHQRFLEASLRGDKALISTSWKQFAKTRKWLDDVPFPQMLRSHPELYRTDWIKSN